MRTTYLVIIASLACATSVGRLVVASHRLQEALERLEAEVKARRVGRRAGWIWTGAAT